MTGNKPVVEKRFEYRGYPCVVIFQTLGHRCGYVGLPKNSKYYEVGYDEIDINCHGGLTYASDRLYEQNDTDIWWIGFDCAHCDDAKDYESLYKYYTDDRSREMFNFWKELDQKYPINDVTVKDLDYVVNECKSIVEQIEKNYWEDYTPPEEDQDAEIPMLFGDILIPMDDYLAAKEALKEETLLDDQCSLQVLNYIFQIALEHAEEDKNLTQEGKLLTCDRCGDTLFVPKNGSQFNVIDGYSEESSTYASYDPNWGYLTCYPRAPDIKNFKGLAGLETDFDSKLLCPSCRSEFSKLMYNFWRIEVT